MHHQVLTNANRLVSIVTIVLLATADSLHAAALRPVRVLMREEQQLEQKRDYGDKVLGETIAGHLSTEPGFVVKNVSIASPSQGRVFYFRPGHETFPVFQQPEPLRVVENAARWAAPKQAPTLPAAHTTRNIEGWNVRVDDRLLHGDGAPKGERALKLLTARLVAITIVVPEPALAKLRAVTIELDQDCGGLKAMQYHPDSGWLKSHGYSEALAKCAHIPTVEDFLSPFENHRMPWVVLHELSHAYHDQVLGFEEPRVLAAWKKFRDSGKYKSVLTSPGPMREHYGLTDQKEFFAEMTECYFGSNDFYPFVTGELKQAEPEVFTLLQEIWGPLPGHAKAGAKGRQ